MSGSKSGALARGQRLEFVVQAVLQLGRGEAEDDDVVEEAVDRLVQATRAFAIAEPLSWRGNEQAQALARFEPAFGGKVAKHFLGPVTAAELDAAIAAAGGPAAG